MYVLIILKDCGTKNDRQSEYLILVHELFGSLSVTLTLETVGSLAEVLSIHGMDTVEFTQLDVAVLHSVSAGQQWM